MFPRLMLVVCILVLAGLGIWFYQWWHVESLPEEVLSNRTAPPEEPPDPTSSLPEALSDRMALLPKTSGPEARSRENPFSQIDGTIDLDGVVKLRDTQGNWKKAPSGAFDLIVWHEGQYHALLIEVQGGAWRATIPPNAKLEVHSLFLENLRVWPQDVQCEILDKNRVTIIARTAARRTLHVLDVETGRHLSKVTMMHKNLPFDYPGIPDNPSVLIENGISPLDLHPPLFEKNDGQRDIGWLTWYWVKASGYAWGSVSINYQNEDGIDRIQLFLAAALEVRLPNFSQWRPPALSSGTPLQRQTISLEPWLRLYASEDKYPCLVTLLRDDAPIQLTHLRPGDYEVRVEFGPSYRDDATLLAADRVELHAGDKKTLTLELTTAPSIPEPVPLAGTLSIHPSWGELSSSIRFKALEVPYLNQPLDLPFQEMESIVGPSRLYWWDAGLVIPARYLVEISELGFATYLDVDANGRRNVQLVVREPAEVRVRLEDAVTGQSIEHLYGLFWRSLDPHTDLSYRLHFDQESRCYLFRAPAGRIALRNWGEPYVFCEKEFTLHSGMNEILFKLERRCGVEVTFKNDDVVLNLPWDHTPLQLKEVDGDGHGKGSSVSYQKHTRYASRPGFYELIVEDIDGFEPVPPRHVKIPYGEIIPLVIQLTRRR